MVMIQGESPGRRAGSALASLATADDDELLARLREGDELAFRALVDRHRPWLVRLCTRLLGHDAHAAEDAAQESLLKLHAAARRDGRPLRLRPWLTVVARNTCVDEQRKRRPELPGELPERPAPGADPFALDPALAEAWPRLAGRHREVLYLREVLGFSYKEIGAVMGLSMPATETLVFRARAALRREYERSGGSAFGCGLLGFHLARLGVGGSRDRGMTDGLSTTAMTDSGVSGLASRVAQWMSTSLPGSGEQAMARVLSVAAGVVVVAASVLPGLAPFADAPPAAAAVGPPVVAAQSGTASAAPPAMATSVVAATGRGPSGPAANPIALKTLLGNAVPADWAPHQARTEATPAHAAPSNTDRDTRVGGPSALRDAAAAARSSDRPSLPRPVRTTSDPGPLRSLVPSPSGPVKRPGRPAHPLQSLFADPTLLPADPFPADPFPAEPFPAEPFQAGPVPSGPGTTPATPADAVAALFSGVGPDSRPQVRDAAAAVTDPAVATVAGDEPALLRRRDG
jgi:RNA polymerase sigma-70 factor (ECF subfamily)